MTDPGPALAKAARELIADYNKSYWVGGRVLQLAAALEGLPTEAEALEAVHDVSSAGYTSDRDLPRMCAACLALIPRREP